MELATGQRRIYRRAVLTPEGWRTLGLRRRQRVSRTAAIRNERLVGRSIFIVPLYGDPLFGVDYIGGILQRRNPQRRI